MICVQESTIACAASSNCTACLYKLFPQGAAEFYRFLLEECKGLHRGDSALNEYYPVNVRPESCPRSKATTYSGLYNSDLSIIAVGDGDLSFSMSISNACSDLSGSAANLTATTHESLSTLQSVYHDTDKNIEILVRNHSRVLHDVDATNFEASSSFFEDSIAVKFDVVVWNFPCVRIDRGADGQVAELEQNKRLLRGFFRSVKQILQAKGEVHVTHKTIEPFSWWNIESIATEEGFSLFMKIVFDRCSYPGYVNRKVLDRKSFPCNDARTFIFVLDEDHKSLISPSAKVLSMTGEKALKHVRRIVDSICRSPSQREDQIGARKEFTRKRVNADLNEEEAIQRNKKKS